MTLRSAQDLGAIATASKATELRQHQIALDKATLRAGVPVVPAAISGTYEALAGRRFYIPRGRPLAVRFGHPLHFHQPRRHASHAEREEITRRIMGHIAAMLHAGRPAEARRGEAGAS